MEAEITIIIPTRNRVAILRESLHHLIEAIGNIKSEIIIINDGDAEVYTLKPLFPQILISNNTGRGVASARNNGAKLAQAEILLFLDDDIWMTSAALSRVLEFHNQHERGILNLDWIYPSNLQSVLNDTAFGRYLVKYKFTTLKGWNNDSPDWKENACFLTNGVTSQNLSFRKNVFNSLGGYNENFPFAGFEDHALSEKIRFAEVPIYIDTSVTTFHNEVDRIKLSPWLERRQRGGVTRKVAVEEGYTDLRLHYSFFKNCIMSIIVQAEPFLQKVSSNKITDRFTFLDQISFFIFNKLLAAANFKGYTGKLK